MKKILAIIRLRSRTINVTTLTGAVITIAQQFGYNLSAETVSAIFVAVAVIMRAITDSSLEDK